MNVANLLSSLLCGALLLAGCGGPLSSPSSARGKASVGDFCFTTSDCDSGEFCDTEANNSGVSGDFSGCFEGGVCTPNKVDGELCPFIPIYVCGCDGRTYTNKCWAHHDGASVAFAGKCPAQAANQR